MAPTTWILETQCHAVHVKILIIYIQTCIQDTDRHTYIPPSVRPGVRSCGRACMHASTSTHTHTYQSIYIYAKPPPWTTAGCRDTATNPPTIRLLVYDPVLKLRGGSICMTAAAFILNSLRPFTQILRNMIKDEYPKINMGPSINSQDSLRCSLKSKPRQYVWMSVSLDWLLFLSSSILMTNPAIRPYLN